MVTVYLDDPLVRSSYEIETLKMNMQIKTHSTT